MKHNKENKSQHKNNSIDRIMISKHFTQQSNYHCYFNQNQYKQIPKSLFHKKQNIQQLFCYRYQSPTFIQVQNNKYFLNTTQQKNSTYEPKFLVFQFNQNLKATSDQIKNTNNRSRSRPKQNKNKKKKKKKKKKQIIDFLENQQTVVKEIEDTSPQGLLQLNDIIAHINQPITKQTLQHKKQINNLDTKQNQQIIPINQKEHPNKIQMMQVIRKHFDNIKISK